MTCPEHTPKAHCSKCGHGCMIVTPQQLMEGYNLRRPSGMVEIRRYIKLRELEDGNWLVVTPR